MSRTLIERISPRVLLDRQTTKVVTHYRAGGAAMVGSRVIYRWTSTEWHVSEQVADGERALIMSTYRQWRDLLGGLKDIERIDEMRLVLYVEKRAVSTWTRHTRHVTGEYRDERA